MQTSNPYIQGILWGDKIEKKTIRYSFWDDSSLDDQFDDYSQSDWSWLRSEKKAVRQALKTWSNIADISFKEVQTNSTQADLGLILFADSGNLLGQFNPPGTEGEGIGSFNFLGTGWSGEGLKPGGYGFITLIHEFGHGLGLAHPHDFGGTSSVYPGVSWWDDQDLGENQLNQGIWTTMSYNDGWESRNGSLIDFGIETYGYQATPMAFDIAAIQSLYGKNTTYKSGNDVYQLPRQNSSGTFYSALWDTGGTDTISAGPTSRRAVINLNEAPLVGKNAGGYVSFLQGIYGGFTIANGVTIENAIAGSGNDRVMGNQADNRLDGRQGNDRLFGQGGHDLLLGGSGQDHLVGGKGNDLLRGNGDRDQLYGSDWRSGGRGEIDRLFGGGGSDIFHLGDRGTIFYRDTLNQGDRSYAHILDFDDLGADADQINVLGSTDRYRLRSTSIDNTQGLGLYFNGNQGEDLLAFLEGDQLSTRRVQSLIV